MGGRRRVMRRPVVIRDRAGARRACARPERWGGHPARAGAPRWGALALALLVATGCEAPGSVPEESPAARRAELTVRSLIAAHESADTALVLDLFWPEATYDDFADQHTYQGVQEIVGHVTAAHAWGDDVYMSVGRVHTTESGAVAEWVFSAVQSRPMGDLAPSGTGREVVLNGVTIIEMEGDRIIRAADYTDTQPMLLQLGARIELPGGRVLELDRP